MAEETKVETPAEKPQEEKVEETKEDVSVKEKITQKLDGIKQAATNFEAIKDIKNAPETAETLPSFFIDVQEKRRIEVDILFDKAKGNILSISRTGLDINFEEFKNLGHTVEWFDFTQPTYEDIASYRQRSSTFNVKANKTVIDGVHLRNFFIIWHLKDWSLKDKKGNKVELKFNEKGSLSTETVTKVYEIFPTLMDVVLTLFEKDIMLSN